MTNQELEGTAKVLRDQQEHAYQEERTAEGLEYAYRASLVEIALRIRRGEATVFPYRPTGGHQPTTRPSRVRKYTLKQIDSEHPKGARRATQTIIARGSGARQGFKPLPMFKTSR